MTDSGRKPVGKKRFDYQSPTLREEAMTKPADERTAKARVQRNRARVFWNSRVIIDGNPATSPDAEKKIITLLAAFAESERSSAIKEAVKWIRENCQVDTGDGIYGNASRYSEKEIETAIRGER